MTRSSLNQTLRRTYVLLVLVLVISLTAKLADEIPGVAKTPLATIAGQVYDYLKDMALVKYSRLSVQPVTAGEWQIVCKMGGMKE